MKPREMMLNDERIVYRCAGKGPLLLFVHGIAGSSDTWRHVMPTLAERFTVLAPDLLGQGRSDKPRGDYSLGAHANTLRDLLDALGHKRATVIGQSFGGGVAMQFAYQFPNRCERLVLVDSGGLGREVTFYLSAAPACDPRPPARRSGGASRRWRTPRTAAPSFAACAM
jgi:pimeloyl-ACP methyl ester carboxylesterase